MKSIIVSLILLFTLFSCSSDMECDQRNSQFQITVNFATGTVKEGGVILNSADQTIIDLCLKVKAGLPLPEGYSLKVLCMGGDGYSTNFIYIELISTSGSNFYLLTFNETTNLVHQVQVYNQTDCLNRWIINIKN
ncbi:hypothetical protein [Chryseobacterium indologenes]|uniref:hypothetical protein n=1 Tax=Chryseobacterium indologenes TaxID=253 RepID=UPI001BCB36E3|nr:hypothetical protein [Chryseobacterium indologenes]